MVPAMGIKSPNRPTLVLTCGDPAGIGPEVVFAAWAATQSHARAKLRVVAESDMLAGILSTRLELPPLSIVEVAPDDTRDSSPETLLVVSPEAADFPAQAQAAVPSRPTLVRQGVISAAGGKSAAQSVEAAFAMVRSGLAEAIVTGPLHKEALHAAGYDVPGHTELLARACGLPDSAASMMLWLGAQPATGTSRVGHLNQPAGLGVVHATLHESLASALAHLSSEGILQAGLRLDSLLTAILGRTPRIAVAALNPHGGEAGLFGDEETRLIAPAVAQLAAAGINVSGPLPADTLFLRASRGDFDGIVAQYHDQGHIPIKLLGMHRAVNITLGLPLVRTSVAHGTAFDIVGKGLADPSSMLAAIDVAVRLVEADYGRRGKS